MPRKPTFELFEAICQELSARSETVLSEDDVDSTLMEALQKHYGETASRRAFERALGELAEHFVGKGSALPFEFNGKGEFRARDKEYVDFVSFASNRRGLPKEDAKAFEQRTLERLAKRLTGALHCVGTPRKLHNKKKDFVKYLEGLGFDKNCLEPRDKDGGLDLVWLPPLGTIPLRPVVSLQCKNASFSLEDANASVGRAHTTLHRHSHTGSQRMTFVVFNDYIDQSFLGRARGWDFIPLGLSDLGESTLPALQTTVL